MLTKIPTRIAIFNIASTIAAGVAIWFGYWYVYPIAVVGFGILYCIKHMALVTPITDDYAGPFTSRLHTAYVASVFYGVDALINVLIAWISISAYRFLFL